MTRLGFYGGVGEIGGTKIVLEDGGHRLLLDFGMSYARRRLYFEEYLQPRVGAGLLDFLELGIIPPLEGVYRADLEPPDLWEGFRAAPGYRRVEGIDAVLLSHAHADHVGHVSLLAGGIPVHATRLSIAICRSVQESGTSGMEQDIVSFAPRHRGKPKGWDQEALLAGKGVQKAPRIERRFVDAGAGGLPLEARCFPVDHSIRGACAWAIRTSRGWVVYTGDLRFHGVRGADTRRFVAEAAKLRPRALLIEATNAGSPKHTSEAEVEERALAAVGDATGLVAADFSARDTDRLAVFLRAARAAGRKLVILPRDAHLLKAIHAADPDAPDPVAEPDLLVYQEMSSNPGAWKQGICEEFRRKLCFARDVAANQDRLVLCFSFFDVNEFPGIRPARGSLWISSMSEPHGEEQEIDLRRLRCWLDHYGFRSLGLPVQNGAKLDVPEAERGLHASGHASAEDLLAIARDIAPAILMPVHTVHPEFFAEGLKGTGIEVRAPAPFGKLEL
jgi:ribonuclease J